MKGLSIRTDPPPTPFEKYRNQKVFFTRISEEQIGLMVAKQQEKEVKQNMCQLGGERTTINPKEKKPKPPQPERFLRKIEQSNQNRKGGTKGV